MTHRYTPANAPTSQPIKASDPVKWGQLESFMQSVGFHNLLHEHTKCPAHTRRIFVYGFLAGLTAAAIMTAPLYGAVYALNKAFVSADETCRLP